MEGGAAGAINGAGVGGPIPSGRSPGDPGKKRGRSKKSSAAAGGGAVPPYRNGKGGPPPGMYDMGPDSPGKRGFPYATDLKGQPVPTPLYQDFASGGRLSPRMDNGFGGGGPPGSGPPFPGHPHQAEAGPWPPEYQTIVPDYFPGEYWVNSIDPAGCIYKYKAIDLPDYVQFTKLW